MTNIGTGAIRITKVARAVKPQPHPRASVRGVVTRGRNVPIKHLVTMRPVIADAEYSPKASTTYADRGIIVRISAVPCRPMTTSTAGRGNRRCTNQPYAARGKPRMEDPMIARGRRYSGWPTPRLSLRSLTYILSRNALHMKTARNEPMAADCQARSLAGVSCLNLQMGIKQDPAWAGVRS